MEKVITKVPAQCRRCGAFFDMGYDLNAEDVSNELALALKLQLLGRKGSLCWSCRTFV